MHMRKVTLSCSIQLFTMGFCFGLFSSIRCLSIRTRCAEKLFRPFCPTIYWTRTLGLRPILGQSWWRCDDTRTTIFTFAGIFQGSRAQFERMCWLLIHSGAFGFVDRRTGKTPLLIMTTHYIEANIMSKYIQHKILTFWRKTMWNSHR